MTTCNKFGILSSNLDEYVKSYQQKWIQIHVVFEEGRWSVKAHGGLRGEKGVRHTVNDDSNWSHMKVI